MALARRSGQRFEANIWPGFVDAMTALLLVLMFVLSIFMVVQAILSETISTQDNELNQLTQQLTDLSAALSFVESRNAELEAENTNVTAALADARQVVRTQEGLLATLQGQLDQVNADLSAAQGRITDFEDQVAALLAERRDLQGSLAATQAERDEALSRADALDLALAQARSEIDATSEEARRAAAEREALDALVAQLQQEAAQTEASLAQLMAQIEDRSTESADLAARVEELRAALDDEERARLEEAAAAEALRYTEERATVILVSDGIETCNPDPCAAARALEQAGIDFTAHVIGFDVTDPEALAQMQCLAGETGGQFLTAANADQLGNALSRVVEEPVHVPQTVRIAGVLQPGGSEITEAINWNILPADGAQYDGTGPGFSIDLAAGRYDVVGIRQSDQAEARILFEVAAYETDQGQRVEVIFPEPEPDPTMMTFRAVIGTEQGPEIETPVIWDVLSEESGMVVDGEMANPLPAMLRQGPHSVTAYWAAQETTSQPRNFITFRKN